MPRFNPSPIFRFLFLDSVRLVELFSALNLLAWAYIFATYSAIMERDSYVAFGALPAAGWAAVFGFAGLMQLTATVASHRHHILHRFIAMALATGCWALVAVSFGVSGIGTTANTNYMLLTLVCAVSGGFLAWKHS